MQTITIFKGLPGSGKTTKAKEIVAKSEGRVKRINKDDLRDMLDSGKYSRQREQTIIAVRNGVCAGMIEGGFDVIIDDTNLHPKHEIEIRARAKDWGAEVVIDDSFCKVPLKECIRRDALRAEPVGKDTIRRMARDSGIGLIEPYYIEGLPTCVICDLDGTLAHMGKRNPFDASTCIDDELDPVVAKYLRFLSEEFTVFFFSGRDEKHRMQTLQWLEKHGFNDKPFLLAMRPNSSMLKDVIVKTAMFEKHVRGQYNVHVVIDDRQQVVDGWRDLGLKVFQVAEGDF